MLRTIDAEPWYDAKAVLGEGPSWDARTGQLSWVDILAARVHVADAEGRKVAELSVPSHVGAALPAARGGWLVPLTDRVAHLRTDGSLDDVVPLEAHLPSNRANDAKCDPAGRAWVGTMNYDETSSDGSLYRSVRARRSRPSWEAWASPTAWDGAPTPGPCTSSTRFRRRSGPTRSTSPPGQPGARAAWPASTRPTVTPTACARTTRGASGWRSSAGVACAATRRAASWTRWCECPPPTSPAAASADRGETVCS